MGKSMIYIRKKDFFSLITSFIGFIWWGVSTPYHQALSGAFLGVFYKGLSDETDETDETPVGFLPTMARATFVWQNPTVTAATPREAAEDE